MAETSQFKGLNDIELEKARLDALRHYHGDRLELHWSALRDAEVRGHLVRSTIMDLALSWRPARTLAGMIGGGGLSSALASAILRRGSFSKRLVVLALRSLGPYVLERAGSLSLRTILSEVGRSLERIRQYRARTREDQGSI